MNGYIEKRIDDYIRKEYKEAYTAGSKLNSHPILNSNKDFGTKYYYNLKPLAFIILRSEILLDYECNEVRMPRRPKEILSKKVLSRIAENYEIEEKLRKITNFYHRKFDGREADWVLVAVWLWIERFDKDIDPVEFFNTRNIYERSRKYIISMSERDIDPVFKEYFDCAAYEFLVDKYDISKDKLAEYVSNRDLMKEGTKLKEDLDDHIKRSDEQYHELEKWLAKLKDLMMSNPDIDSNEPGDKAVLKVLKTAVRYFEEKENDRWSLVYRRISDKDYYVIGERCPANNVIHLVRDIRDNMKLVFDADDLCNRIRKDKKNPKTGEIEAAEIPIETIKNYLKPSSGDTSPIA